MGNLDRILRIVIVILIAVLYYANAISGTIAIILLVVSVVFIITSFIGFCPLYSLIGIQTKTH